MKTASSAITSPAHPAGIRTENTRSHGAVGKRFGMPATGQKCVGDAAGAPHRVPGRPCRWPSRTCSGSGSPPRAMPRLRRADCSRPGIRRRGRGRGFEYLESSGVRVVDKETLERIRGLGIPPAWKDVWISPDPLGHLQATGIDAAGRKQYLYHERWRLRRDQEKFDRVLEFAATLPSVRAELLRLLAPGDLTRGRVLACAVRLLDLGFFRIGGEEYAEENDSFGLATIQKRHVRLGPGCELTFDYPAKSGAQRVQTVIDAAAYGVVAELKRRRGGGDELLAYKRGRTLVRRHLRGCQRAHSRADGRPVLRQGLPHVECDRSRRRLPGRLGGRRPLRHRTKARQVPGRARRRPLPRQYAGGLPCLVHRSAGLRPLRCRHHRFQGARARWRQRGRRPRRRDRERDRCRGARAPGRQPGGPGRQARSRRRQRGCVAGATGATTCATPPRGRERDRATRRGPSRARRPGRSIRTAGRAASGETPA